MEVRRGGCIGCEDHRRIVTRSGHWARIELVYADRTETRFADFASGTSFTIFRSPAGEIEMATVDRARPGDWGIPTRSRTDRRDRLLGDECEIWLVAAEYYNEESCETADGIQLWYRFPRLNPEAPHEGRAVSVERRAVRPEEVRPPPDFFALAPWPRVAGAGAASGHAVLLASTTRGRRLETVRRRQGDVRSGRYEDHVNGHRSYWAGDGVRRLYYRADADGRPAKLEVQVTEKARPPLFRAGPERWAPVRGRGAARRLGERCTWQDETSMRSTDSHYECRTADGVPLMIEDHWHWDSRIDLYRAERVERRPLTGADLALPAAATDWASWGVAPPRAALRDRARHLPAERTDRSKRR